MRHRMRLLYFIYNKDDLKKFMEYLDETLKSNSPCPKNIRKYTKDFLEKNGSKYIE